MLSFCGGERQLRCALAFGWKSEASEACELARGTWQGLKPRLEPSGLCLWGHKAFHYTFLPPARKFSIIKKSPTLSVNNRLGKHLPCAGDWGTQTNQTWLMGAGSAEPGPEEQCMLEHGKGGRYGGFMGEVAFELNLER